MATRGVNVKGGEQRSACPACTVHCDLGDLGLCDAAVDAAVEVARLDWHAIAGGEHQAGFGPCAVSLIAVGVLLLLTNLERGDTQIRQREGCLGCVGLGLAAQKLAATRCSCWPTYNSPLSKLISSQVSPSTSPCGVPGSG